MRYGSEWKRLAGLVLALSMVFGLTACAAPGGAPEETTAVQTEGPKPASADLMAGLTGAAEAGKPADDAFLKAQLAFDLSLFQGAAAADAEQQNLLLSPLSVQLALAMTANGAEGETLAQMEALLGGGLPLTELNAYLKGYLESLSSSETAKLSIADAIWFRDDGRLTVEPDFLQKNADYYNAQAYEAPFDGSTVDEINAWVKEHTDGMIEKMLEELSPEAMMVLMNAVAFDAKWAEPYFDYQVSDGTFTSQKGDRQTVPMMHSEEEWYLNDGQAEGFVKHYDGWKYSFAALLPEEGTDIYDYVAGLTPERLLQTLQNPESVPVIAAMPKFSFDYSLTMNGLLQSLGMTKAFDDRNAEFGKLGHAQENLYISTVLHKTHIDVDENGTKAGAATMVMVTEAAEMEMPEPKVVTLDRPFLFLILDNETKLPVFLGILTSAA